MNKNKPWLICLFDALYKIRVVPYLIGIAVTGILIFYIARETFSEQLSKVFQILWCLWGGSTLGVDLAIGKGDWGV